MDDRKLLEWAAKAAGIEVNFDDWLDGGAWVKYKAHGLWWNPLVSDGDALKLAVKTQIALHHFESSCAAASGTQFFSECHFDDPCAATRRAITRAAADLGKQKGKGM